MSCPLNIQGIVKLTSSMTEDTFVIMKKSVHSKNVPNPKPTQKQNPNFHFHINKVRAIIKIINSAFHPWARSHLSCRYGTVQDFFIFIAALKTSTDCNFLIQFYLLICYRITISVVDSDQHGAKLIWISWIRIQRGNADPDPDTEARKLTKIYE